MEVGTNMTTVNTTTTPHQHTHTRAPRTPESYFNVPESIALLNIVKSERIQSAFQSNRKNHASVWEMVAEVLNRFSSRKRSAKQCCNRYENLKKIYTQLKKNPEKHVRRNWPYMYLFREIEETRGECWGANGKRITGHLKANGELSYYHRRRAAALSMLMNKDSLSLAIANNNANLERFVANRFADTEMNDINEINDVDDLKDDEEENSSSFDDNNKGRVDQQHIAGNNLQDRINNSVPPSNYLNIKYEQTSDHEFSDINLMHTNYNGNHNLYSHNIDPNILHPDVIVDTDNVSDTSSISIRSKRKTSTSTDAESTNYELIEYLKRREKRDEDMFKRMEEREERLLNLLERTVMAIECLANGKTSTAKMLHTK